MLLSAQPRTSSGFQTCSRHAPSVKTTCFKASRQWVWHGNKSLRLVGARSHREGENAEGSSSGPQGEPRKPGSDPSSSSRRKPIGNEEPVVEIELELEDPFVSRIINAGFLGTVAVGLSWWSGVDVYGNFHVDTLAAQVGLVCGLPAIVAGAVALSPLFSPPSSPSSLDFMRDAYQRTEGTVIVSMNRATPDGWKLRGNWSWSRVKWSMGLLQAYLLVPWVPPRSSTFTAWAAPLEVGSHMVAVLGSEMLFRAVGLTLVSQWISSWVNGASQDSCLFAAKLAGAGQEDNALWLAAAVILLCSIPSRWLSAQPGQLFVRANVVVPLLAASLRGVPTPRAKCDNGSGDQSPSGQEVSSSNPRSSGIEFSPLMRWVRSRRERLGTVTVTDIQSANMDEALYGSLLQVSTPEDELALWVMATYAMLAESAACVSFVATHNLAASFLACLLIALCRDFFMDRATARMQESGNP